MRENGVPTADRFDGIMSIGKTREKGFGEHLP